MVNLPPDIAAVLPERAANEQEWQNALRLALPRLLDVRLFRVVTGAKRIARGGWMHGAPVGAADLNGYARGGRRIEIECKYGYGAVSAEQQRWIEAALAWGVVAMIARYQAEETLAENILRVAAAVAMALGAEGRA